MIMSCCLFVIDVHEHLIKQVKKEIMNIKILLVILSTGLFSQENVDQCHCAISDDFLC